MLRCQKTISIYHKLPKPREIIKPEPLGSQEIRRIPGFEFRELPCLNTQSQHTQLLNNCFQKTISRPDTEQATLFHYYSQRRDLLVYDRNPQGKDSEEAFNCYSYCPKTNTAGPISPLKPHASGKLGATCIGFEWPNAESNQQTTEHRIPTARSSPLRFESNFQSGNLSKAYRIGECEFDLLLNSDINTASYTQWFYFKISNAGEATEARFNIVNLMKSSSLYSKGMKVLICSSLNNVWVRGGSNITYRRNNLLLRADSTRTYSTLSFGYSFQPGEEVYFVYTHPYTYSQLCQHLDQLEAQHLHSRIFWREVLCQTPCGNRCQILTISKKPFRGKPIIFLSARVHPGETVSSFVLNGMIDFLLSDLPEAQQLRSMFVWKIVPMLNPDGVIHGNYRCNLAGHDLNRRWQNPDSSLHPQIYYYKKYILKCSGASSSSELPQFQHNKSLVSGYVSVGSSLLNSTSFDSFQSSVAMVIDLHGHSNKKNIFIYACSDESAKEFPFLASKLVRGFSFKDCAFEVESKKEGTARVSLWRDLQIPNIFTVQSTFCSFEGEDAHLKLRDYEQIGKGLCRAIFLYYSKQETDIATKQNLLRQLLPVNFAKEYTASGNPNDSADSEEDNASPKRKLDKPAVPPKKTANLSLAKVIATRPPERAQTPVCLEKVEKRTRTDVKQTQLQVPNIIDIFMTPFKVSLTKPRQLTYKKQRLAKEKFLGVSQGGLSPTRSSPPKRVFHYGANFHFPQIKP